MIKQKLQELLGVCLDKGVHFDYSAHVNMLCVYPKINGSINYIADHYCLDIGDIYNTEEKHIAKLNEFIKQVQELD